MKNSLIISLILLLSITTRLFAQPKSHIEHYNLVDGLPQRSIMNIIQDKKGFIWLATWDGLSKFDGYTFTNYKTTPEDSIIMRTTRIDKIYEDHYGYIWLYTYNRESFRFDPRTEKFVAAFDIDGTFFKTSFILPMPSGKVWLTSSTMGAICVPDTTSNFYTFNLSNKKLHSNKVNTVYEDKYNNSWILTDNGLLQVPDILQIGEDSEQYFFSGNERERNVPFFSANETETEVWFGSEKGRIWCYDFQEERFKVFETGVKSDIISIQKAYDNLFVILTSKDGFIICDKNKTNLTYFNRTTLKTLPTDEMISCFIDSSNNIWFEMNCPGIAKFNLLKNQLSYYEPVNYRGGNYQFSPEFFIFEDKSNHIWVHPHGFFSFYDRESDKILPFFNDPFSSNWRFSDMLHDYCSDMQGNLWLGTRTGGLEKIVFDNELFKLNSFYSNEMFSTGYEVRSLFEDENKNIWVGNMNGALSVYDQERNFIGFLCENGTISKSAKPLYLLSYTIHQDREGNIWIGTKGHGIFRLTSIPGVNNSFHLKQYMNNPDNIYSLSNNAVYSICEDEEGRIWIGTYGGGINLFDSSNEAFINHNNDFNDYPIEIGYQIRTVNYHEGKLYIGTTLGMIACSIERGSQTISDYKLYTKNSKAIDGLLANDIYSIYVTKSNELYIGTFGGGLSKAVSWDKFGFADVFKTYNNQNGLHSDIVLSVIEDTNGHLWINSEGNLFRFTLETEVFEQFNDVSRTISNQYFTEAFPLLTSDGELIYGCTHGTLSFIPNTMSKYDYTPYLALTKFKVANNDYPLKNIIDDISEVTLTHKENVFSIEYAALDYNNPHGVSYNYKLEGFDKEWVNANKQRIANYTNIPPGKYIFKVRSTNSNGTWVDNERELQITIVPSFWQTHWAYLLYVVLFILVLYVVLNAIIVFYRMRDKMRLEQQQTELKTRFFTDISHEIRTPLTMIVTPIENIIDNDKTNPEIKGQLRLVLKNTNRMLKMVNQILDFRKIQKQKLSVKEVSLGTYVQEICESVESQGVTIVTNNQIHQEKVWVDIESIEKLLFNLLSNSIKSTGSGKRIEVNVFRKDKGIALQVKDQGKGMTKEFMNKIFTRFSSFNTDKSKPSTGIGLSIVKEIVDKHHARITVDSELNKGSSFTIVFQNGVEHFIGDENVEIIRMQTDMQVNENSLEPIEVITNNDLEKEIESEVKTEQLTILIVEDDNDLREFIHSILSPYYAVLEAANGKEGFEQVLKHMPDFVLSDIMMPEMDGMEFLKQMRSNPDTSHIPFILLTAKTNIDDKFEGISLGADDYITKPFNVKLLIAKIENILKQRKRFTNYLMNIKGVETTVTVEGEEIIQESKLTEQDEQFLRFLQEEILNNIDNSDFTIEDLVAKTTFSRRVFFNKIKSLTGQAPVEFIREIRIRQAAELLKTQEYRVKEVTYMVGFSDIRYFTQRFKEMYGMTPVQFKEMFKEK